MRSVSGSAKGPEMSLLTQFNKDGFALNSDDMFEDVSLSGHEENYHTARKPSMCHRVVSILFWFFFVIFFLVNILLAL